MKKIQLLLFAALAFANAEAQKLPDVQQTSFRFPANVKIDGKAIEWADKFQAYNRNTDFFYTMANNDEELYLIIQANDRFVFSKIIDRGLTLSVKNPKSGKEMNITFPYTTYTTKNGRLSSSFSIAMITSGKVPEEEIGGYNKMLKDNHKFIKLDGIDGLDSLVSVYNEDGIRASELFGNNKVYTLEITVKLKLMGLSAKDGDKFSYHLRVNSVGGAPILNANNMAFIGGGEITPEMRQQAMADMTEKIVKQFGGTDFKAEYTLAK